MSGAAHPELRTAAPAAPAARPPNPTALSRPCHGAQAPYTGLRVACRRMPARIPAGGARWKAAWASRVLGGRERALFDELAVSGSRALEWLAARTAAKECIALLAAEAYGIALGPGEIEILPDERGAPVALVPALEGAPELPLVSLTHSDGEAAALAMLAPPGATGVGVDIERLRPRRGGLARAAADESERALLAGLPGEAAEEWLLRLWCAREAAGKARGTGVGRGADAPRARSIDRATGAVCLVFAGSGLRAWTSREADIVLASVLPGGTSPGR